MVILKVVCNIHTQDEYTIRRPRKMKNVVMYCSKNVKIVLCRIHEGDQSIQIMTHCLFCSENFLLYIISPLILYYIYLVLMISHRLFTCQFLFTFIAYPCTQRKCVSLCKTVLLLKYVN